MSLGVDEALQHQFYRILVWDHPVFEPMQDDGWAGGFGCFFYIVESLFDKDVRDTPTEQPSHVIHGFDRADKYQALWIKLGSKIACRP